jgi:Zn-dependent protease
MSDPTSEELKSPRQPSRPTLRIGRWRETDVDVHPSMILLMLLLVWAASEHLLPAQEGEGKYSTLEYWILGTIGALLLLGSVVAHEVAHVIVARMRGLRVARLTLFFHAGHAPDGDAPRSPFEELVIAGSGPAVTVAIAAGSLIGAQALPDVRHVTPLLQFLATTNFVLALAHLMPGMPLDGGRLLHAVTWGLTGDRHRGMRWAGRIGVAFAALLAAACVLGISVTGLGSGWTIGLLMAIALGLQCAGAARMARLRGGLDGLAVSHLMEQPPAAVSRITSVADALAGSLPASPEGAWLVEFGGRLGAIVTLAQLMEVPEDERFQTPIGQVATRLERQHLLHPRLALEVALQRLLGERLPLLPVVHHGTLIGILRRDAVFQAVKAAG